MHLYRGNDSTIVVPSFFAELEYLRDAINKVQHALHTSKTVLKNVDPKKVKAFIPYGFRPYNKNEAWCSDARFDDQTFPQSIVDLKKVTEHKGKRYHQ